MTKKSKKKEEQPGDQPRASKRKQQSAPLASGVSVPEKAKKPKGVAAEAAVSSVSSPPAEVAKGASPSNVAEEEQKMLALPKCAASPKEAIGAGAVPAEQSVGVEAVKGQGVAGEKLEEAEENKDDDDDDDDSGGDDDEDEESGDEESEYAPPEDGSEGTGTVTLADDVDNLPDVVKPSGKEKVSSPFDAPILPIAKTMLVKQGKKGKQQRPCWLSRERRESRGQSLVRAMTRAFSYSPMMRQSRVVHRSRRRRYWQPSRPRLEAPVRWVPVVAARRH
jgi:hypothetical protein